MFLILGAVGGAAVAADPPSQIGSCVFVANPTASVHTECAGMDLSVSQGNIPGLDLDYADFSGANLAGSALLISSSSMKHVNLANADLTGAPIVQLDFRTSTLKGATLDDALAIQSNFAGLDLRGASFTNTNAVDSDFSDTNLTGVHFAPGAIVSGSDFSGATITAATLPANLTGMDLRGMDFSALAEFPSNARFGGSNLTGVKFDGIRFDGLDLSGAEVLQSSFHNVSFSAGSEFAAGGANFTEADFAGVDFSPLGSYWFGGAPFAWADFEGATVPLSPGSYYGDANLEGAQLYGNGNGAIFNGANLKDAVALHSGSDGDAPLTFMGAQFNDANLVDVDFDNTQLDGATFVDADLTRADIQSTTLHGIGGIVFVRTNLTDAKLPPAKNLPDYGWDEKRWLYGIFVHDSILTGTSLVNADVEYTAPSTTSTTVTFPLAPAFVNGGGRLPYGDSYDGAYWWGAKDVCDRASGDTFPVGKTVVNCSLIFEHSILGAAWAPPVPLDWSIGTDGSSGNPAVRISGIRNPIHPAIARGSTLKQLLPDTYFPVDDYKYGATYLETESGIFTSSASAFTVTVNAIPTIDGAVVDAIAGQAYTPVPLEVAGYPAPAVTVTAGVLPAGISITPAGVLQGTPEPGTGGDYPVTVRASNKVGAAELPLTLRVIEPTILVDHADPLYLHGELQITGTGFTPGGDVEVWTHDPAALVTTLTSSSAGDVTGTIYADELGTHHLELVDVTTQAAAVSADFTVLVDAVISDGPTVGGPVGDGGTAPAADGDLASTGSGLFALWIAMAAAAAGGLLYLVTVVRRRRVNGSPHA